ncbi:hypothetical protein EDM53_02975 [Rickettsiales endosymbiont of Peranema trichophorum]|uniref:hypothetical protein n=1 Tax=Rickettsiales endosymbiont of Peranema trichophorum TaxID=2486577 RepID=UPI001023919D|nr:hypothetical protein [Rickettsiales endosymbiont of Peranema trichophorum]RZI47238.1 hypothetical protein EDM53_02975 [Rickettsiales endosymbiont of Peranema trichophorum]
MAKKISKNDNEARKANVKVKEIGGKAVQPALYNGTRIGHGKGIVAVYSDTGLPVYGKDGRPVPYSNI